MSDLPHNPCCGHIGYVIHAMNTFFQTVDKQTRVVTKIIATCPNCENELVVSSAPTLLSSSQEIVHMADEAFAVSDAEQIIKGMMN